MRNALSWFPWLAALLAAWSAPTLVGQTFLVDANNGPGTQFTDLPAAVAVVPDGATLDVRPGNYSPFALQGRSLRILAVPGATVLTQFANTSASFSNLPPTGTVLVKGLAFARFPLGGSRISVSGCQGSVLLEDVTETGTLRLQIDIANSTHVQIRDATGVSTLVAANSNVVLVGGTYGAAGFSNPPIAIDASNGSMQILDAVVSGSVSQGSILNAAIRLQGGSLRLLGHTSLSPGLQVTAPAVTGVGAVRIEPTVTLTGASLPSSLHVLTATMVSLTASRQGNVVNANVQTTAGLLVATALSLPAGPSWLSGIADPIWLDGNALSFVGLGIANPTLTASVPVPPGLSSSIRATFQAIAIDQTGLMQVSNPSFVILR